MAYVRRTPDTHGRDCMEINIATQEMEAWVNGQYISTPVIIGKSETPTTAFIRILQNQPHADNPASDDQFGVKSFALSPASHESGRTQTEVTHKFIQAGHAETLFRHNVRAFSNGIIHVKDLEKIIPDSDEGGAAFNLPVLVVFKPVFFRDGEVLINTSDPYGWARHYRCPHAFAQAA